MRPSGRTPEAMRAVILEPGVAKYAEGSCLARFGDTHVLCMATVEARGVVEGIAVLDLDYAEDSTAETDANFVLTGGGGIVGIQATAEGTPFDEAGFTRMLALPRAGIAELTRQQRAALGV